MNGRSIGICVAALALAACDGGGGDLMASGGEAGAAGATSTTGTAGAGGDYAPESVALCHPHFVTRCVSTPPRYTVAHKE